MLPILDSESRATMGNATRAKLITLVSSDETLWRIIRQNPFWKASVMNSLRFCVQPVLLGCVFLLASNFGWIGSGVSLAQTPTAQAPATASTTPPVRDAVAAQSTATANKVITLPVDGRGVDSGLFFQSVANELHWVSGSVAGFARVFGIEATGTHITPTQLDTLVQNFPTVFSYQSPANAPRPDSASQVLAVDTAALSRMLAEKKSGLRRWLAGLDGQALSEMTRIAETWPNDKSAPAPARIVIVTPGLHSPTGSAVELGKVIHQRTHFPICVFRYPNDGPISESSQWLIEELQELHHQYPQSHLTLVTHSMGGLVARGAIELSRLDGDSTRSSLAARVRLDQLILICPPNHGSALGEYGPLLEGFEQLYNLTQRREDGSRERVLVKMITDGFNEASAELNPASDLLKELNGRERDAAVRYTILAGDAGPLKPGMTSLLGGAWERLATAIQGPKEVDTRVRDLLACRELQQGLGDGVVSVESAQLAGVDDFVLLPMHHLSWALLDTPAGKEMVDAIVARLGVSL